MAKTLRVFEPVMDPDESDIREILMVPHLYDWLYQKNGKKTLSFKANIRAFLKRYVIGKEIDNRDYMKSWKLDVFEFRVQLQPRRENTRIFGAFIKEDTFVAIHQKLRSEFGGKDDAKWDKALYRVVEEMAKLFPGHPLVRSVPFSNCVTANAYDWNLGG